MFLELSYIHTGSYFNNNDNGAMNFPMIENTSSPHKVNTKTKKKSQKEIQKIKLLSKAILAEAKKIAKLEIEKVAMEVLSEAIVMARWEKKPFYIS